MTGWKAPEMSMNSTDVDFRRWFKRYCAEAMAHVPACRALAWLVTVSVALTLIYAPVSADETAWQDIAGELMSPACPGRTLLNCTSEHAGQWQELIKQKVDQGVPRNEIMQYFVNMGGEEVLASPPKRGFTLTVWLLPAFAIVNGAGLIILLTTKWTRRVHSREQPVSLPAALHPQHTPSASADPYLSRVRKDLQDL